ncbi:hypothetical protein K8R62_02865 [bacterium]|nr:hypothetical protein [bacterium]
MLQNKIRNIACFSVFFLLLLSLTSCSFGKSDFEKNGLKYKNEPLNFEIILPQNFEKRITQRKDGEGYVDIEFFVPTSDRSQELEVKSYAKPIFIRIFRDTKESDFTEKIDFEILGSKNNNLYAIKFWDYTPKDWQNRWSDKIEKDIINSFKIK